MLSVVAALAMALSAAAARVRVFVRTCVQSQCCLHVQRPKLLGHCPIPFVRAGASIPSRGSPNGHLRRDRSPLTKTNLRIKVP